MQELIEAVQKLSAEELERANKIHPMFADGHHAYGVIKEEIEETKAEMKRIDKYFDDFWGCVCNNADKTEKRYALENLESCAILCACEAVQVAAMARKAVVSMEKKTTDKQNIIDILTDIRDMTINSAHTMTNLGLTETVDSTNRFVTDMLKKYGV